MIHVIASLRVRAGKVKDFLEAFRPYAVDVRKERGCISYIAALEIDAAFVQQPADKDVVRIIETWEDLDALSDHIAALEKSAYREKTKELIKDRSITVLQEA
jgi:quinol monooxygenase YgiN